MAISPINSSRCCSKYVFSLVPATDADRCCDDMVALGGVLRVVFFFNN